MRNKGFVTDLIWNYGSLLVLSVGGFLFSIIIINWYDAATLGVFNQVYAYYILLSQVAVGGIHISITKHTSDCHSNRSQYTSVFLSGVSSAGALSVLTVIATAAVLKVLMKTGRADVVCSMWYVLPGLILFSINKCVLGYLNGLSRMKAYAVFQALRNLLIAAAIAVLALLKAPGNMLSLSFTIAELAVFLVALPYLAAQKLLQGVPDWSWIGRHLRFGLRILPGNIVLEFNSKIDVICLGLVLQNNTIVGYYSFAALFVEGFYQLLVVIRRNYNPLFPRYQQEGTLEAEIKTIKDLLNKYLYAACAVAGCLVCAGFYLICLLMNRAAYVCALIPLAVMLLGIVLNSRHIVFGNLLSQTGYPVHESAVNVMAAACNFVLNFLMIYFFGMMGAAIATAMSYFVFSGLLYHWVKQDLQIVI